MRRKFFRHLAKHVSRNAVARGFPSERRRPDAITPSPLRARTSRTSARLQRDGGAYIIYLYGMYIPMGAAGTYGVRKRVSKRTEEYKIYLRRVCPYIHAHTRIYTSCLSVYNIHAHTRIIGLSASRDEQREKSDRRRGEYVVVTHARGRDRALSAVCVGNPVAGSCHCLCKCARPQVDDDTSAPRTSSPVDRRRRRRSL